MKLAVGFMLLGCVIHIQGGVYTDRFSQQYNKIKNISNGYFSKDGIPYHAAETLIVDGPDYGHITTSTDFSYFIWLEALYGAVSKDFENFNKAWQLTEDLIVPKLQENTDYYDSSRTATYYKDEDSPSDYPVRPIMGRLTGQDPLSVELGMYYHNHDIYSFHRLLDVDNIYGFGNVQGECTLGPSKSGPSLIRSFSRGKGETIWQTVPHPTCDNQKYGSDQGFSTIFTLNNPAPQYEYSVAPDADARAIQASFLALQWAKAAGKESGISNSLAKATKLGDYLRYSLFDEYFKRIGNCTNDGRCKRGEWKDSAHYLISYSFNWGGFLSSRHGLPWRNGNSAAHIGFQNPLTAHALAEPAALKPKKGTAGTDWKTSLHDQLELYTWLQTPEGAFAGGVTNSWNGKYDTPPANIQRSTFHGMWYDSEPGHRNPPSNNWYGFQAWTADRLAQFYYYTGNVKAQIVLNKWVSWIVSEIRFNGTSYQLPEQLKWDGVPPAAHVSVTSYGNNVGTASATARALSYYAAKSNNATVKDVAKKLLDGIWEHQTPIGVSTPETLAAYKQFNSHVPLPADWDGKYPNGDVLNSNSTFISIRSWYKKDKNWPLVEAFLNGGEAPQITYHRLWSQSEVAIAQGTYGLLFNE